MSDSPRKSAPELAGTRGDQEVTPILVDARRAAQLLSVSTRTLDRWRKAGKVPSLQLGGVRRYRVSDLHRFAEQGGDA